jgi:kelch motif-containing protein
MHRRFAVVLLAATAAAAVFVMPAQASGKSTHRALRSSVHALRAPRGSDVAQKPSVPNIAWVAGAPMPVALAEQGGGVGFSGFFWSIGGYNGSGVVQNNTQRYSKGANTWAAGAPIPGAPSAGWADAAFCFDSAAKKIHVVNGVDGSFLYAAHQVYDPLANTWTYAAAPNIPAAGNYYSQDSGCAFIGGKMYLFGGYGLTDAGGTAGLQTLTWVYDPATDTWSDTGKSMVTSYLWQGYTSTATAAYSAGGLDLGFVQHNNTESFTPAGGWVAGAALPQALGGVGEGTVSGRIVIWGGQTTAGTMSNKTYACTLPACGSWTTLGFNIPAAKGYFAFGSGTSVYSAGGYDSAFAVLASSEHLP